MDGPNKAVARPFSLMWMIIRWRINSVKWINVGEWPTRVNKIIADDKLLQRRQHITMLHLDEATAWITHHPAPLTILHHQYYRV